MGRPTGVVVIAALWWFAAFWVLLTGIALIAGAALLHVLTMQLSPFFAGLGLVGGIVVTGLGVAIALVGYGLFALQEWARMTVVVLSVIGIVFAVLAGIGIFGRLFRLAVNIAIVWYLTLPRVKAVFHA